MKKIYDEPCVQIMTLHTEDILTGSPIKQWAGDFETGDRDAFDFSCFG